MKNKLLILAAAMALMAPVGAFAARGFVVVNRPVFAGGFYGPYGPYWGEPYWAPGYYGSPNVGDVKIDTKVKDADVFINGAFAGNTRDSKTMHLAPGSYNIEIREAGQTKFAERVYVVRGKTLKLHPAL